MIKLSNHTKQSCNPSPGALITGAGVTVAAAGGTTSATGVTVRRGVGRVLVGAGVTAGAGVGGVVGAAVGGRTWMDWKGMGLDFASEKRATGRGGLRALPALPMSAPVSETQGTVRGAATGRCVRNSFDE